MEHQITDQNPYQSTAGMAELLDEPASARRNLRKFHRQVNFLGGIWLLLGVVAGIFAFALPPAELSLEMEGSSVAGLGPSPQLVLALASVIWVFTGVLTCCKLLPGLYLGLVLSYFGLIVAVWNFSVCPLPVYGCAIIQAHRMITWSNRFRKMGIA